MASITVNPWAILNRPCGTSGHLASITVNSWAILNRSCGTSRSRYSLDHLVGESLLAVFLAIHSALQVRFHWIAERLRKRSSSPTATTRHIDRRLGCLTCRPRKPYSLIVVGAHGCLPLVSQDSFWEASLLSITVSYGTRFAGEEGPVTSERPVAITRES